MTDWTAQQVFAELYDLYVKDWPGELDYYRELISQPLIRANGLLEIACGTGRIAARLVKEGVRISGLDLSPELLEKARQKCADSRNVRWLVADMRTFELGEKFGGVIIPGHSFQFMTTPEEQVQCLEHIYRHLVDGGWLVIHLDHQDFRWLAGHVDQKEPVRKCGDVLTHPITYLRFRKSNFWTYEPATQTAVNHLRWEQVDDRGQVINTWQMEPMRLHCVFRFEMEHLLKRVGYSIEAVYGDFFKGDLTDQSESMVWVARKEVSFEAKRYALNCSQGAGV